MYSQYMDGSFSPLRTNRQHRDAAAKSSPSDGPDKTKSNVPLGDLTGGIFRLLSSIGKPFASGQLDSGDILLVLIILFLFLEGDNLELVITLGLMLLLGFIDD